jgi:hypothetical protein
VTSVGNTKVKIDYAWIFKGQVNEILIEVKVYTVKVEGVKVTGKFVIAE